MPACICGLCRARRDGRLEEYMDWTQQAMALARLGLPACTHRWRRVRTVGHPFKGELECENCYASESKTAPFLIEEAAL